MRILFAIHTWHPEGRGGTETHAHGVAQALTAKGHQLGIFARTGQPDRPEYEVTTGWEGKTSITRINNTFRDTSSFEWIYKNRAVHEAFVREIDEFKPDLVHIHHLTGLSSTIVETLKARGIPVVITLHDFWTVCPRGQRMTRDLELCETVDRRRCATCLAGLWPHLFAPEREDVQRLVVDQRGTLSPAVLAEWDRHMRYVLDLCDLVVCPSAFHRERMLDFPLDPERVIALPHGIETGRFSGAPRQPSRPRRIGYIGSVIPVKGVHVLIDAFRRLGRKDLSLDIHGEILPFHDDLDYGDRLREMARGLDNVRFHGGYEPERIAEILAGIDILVAPSLWWETFCLTIREGLLAGIPVVASDLGAMREALDGERDGVLFDPGDAEDLRAKLEKLIDDEDHRARFLNRGEGVLPMDPYLEQLEAVYERAIAIARERAPVLVVAPPSFPAPPAVPAPAAAPAVEPLHWDRLGVAVRHEGPAAVAVATRLPGNGRPKMEVTMRIREAGRDLGTVDLELDLEPVTGARPAAEPAEPAAAAAVGSSAGPAPRAGKAREPGSGVVWRHSPPRPRPVRRTSVARPNRLQRQALEAVRLQKERWVPGRHLGHRTKEAGR